ncbi:MAG: WD40-like beta Propeller containing protein [Bacteroidetes bacterium]|nr:WD40-like beta Propeller containing protein [Bacteroidota bacterium]
MNLNHIRHTLCINRKHYCYLFLFLAIFYCSDSYSQVKNEDDLKKQAEKYFEEEDYNSAYKLFAQLVSLYPKDPDYNYKLGVCMLYTEPDKKKPYSYLQIATKNPADAPKDALFYLAKTYHINYRFDDAIKFYTEYKKTGSASSIKKLQVDREIQACKNGKRLLSNLTDLVVITKKQLNEADYFKGYDIKDIGGKLLVKPDEYKSGYDKKKKDKSVVYLPRKAERLYYSSFGESGNTGRDIYYVNKLPNGTWSKPTMMPASINTEFDEDYPFLHPNGKTLYFSSKGFNSMGGYDVFKTTIDEATQTWSKPENMEFPINSPDDDILFVTDSLEKTAFFSTGRYSPYGKLDVLKINTERRPMNFAVVKGSVVKEEASQSVKSKISVKNMENGEIVGTFQAQDNGDYNLELPNGGKFIFTVETPGIATQSDAVQIPVAYTLKPYKQLISYDNKILKIINYFEGDVTDENYSMMIDLIEKKAKLEVNETEPYNNSLLKDASKNQNASEENKNLNSVSTTNPTVQSETNTNKNVTNEQLLEIAKTDAKEASDEAAKLKQEAQDAFGLATQKTAESVEKQKEADEALANANAITDVAKKNEELTKANQLKEDAKIATNVANTATNLAKKLEVDAGVQQKEADLTNQYISQLDAVIKNKNNKEALTKLGDIQKELDDLSKQKNQSSELLNSLKAESELKQQELTSSEKKSNSIVNEINAIKNETENLEKDLANESDKSIKENISAQIRELNNEVELKNKDLATNNQKIENLKNEVDGVNQELQIASKILNETTESTASNTENKNNSSTAKNNPTTQSANNNTTENNTPTLSYGAIKNKYDDKINTSGTDKTNKESLAKQNDVFKTYNKEISDLIAFNKNELSKTTDAAQKKKLNDELKQLENQKTKNDGAIASNNSTIKQLESNTVASNETNNTSNNTTSSENNANATNTTNTSESIAVIKNKYNEQINASNTDKTNKESIVRQNDVLNAYNKELSTLISTIKNEAAKNNDAAAKEKLNTEIAQLENQINQNNNQIASNDSAIGVLESNVAANNNSANTASISTNSENNNAGSTTNTNSQKDNVANNLASDNDPIKSINVAGASDKNTLLTELTTVKEGLNANSNAAKDILTYNDYKETNSSSVKESVTRKFDIAKQNETELNNLINSTENTLNSSSTKTPEAILTEAENLSTKAFEQRKESTTKTGTEKENLIKQATENEKLSVDKKLEASVISQSLNKSKFENNASNLAALKTLTGEKTNNEISQANLLIDEAALNFKQAQKLRTEAESYPAGAAKLGGLGNAEEKENEALAKQQKALEILSKTNPGYKITSPPSETNTPELIAAINNQITKTSQSQMDAYLELSKVNQSELNAQNDKLLKNTAFKSPDNKQAQDLKINADNLNNEAKALIGQSLMAKTPSEKANLLLKANEKEIAALKTLNQATELVNNNSTVASNSNTVTANEVNNEAVKNNNNSRTANENAVSSNTVTNNQETASNTTNTVSISNEANATSTNTVVAGNNETNSENATASTTVSQTNPTNNNSATIDGNGVGDEASKLKAGLNNSTETNLTTFNSYTNSDALSLKDQALQKINAALSEDKQISSSLDNVTQLAASNSSTGTLSQESISSLVSEADKLNDEAFALRKSAATKTGPEKETDLTSAKNLEATAINKKVEAADKQKQLNNATYEANKQSLEDLAALAKGKNIAELGTVEMQVNEASLLLKQATNLRTEADSYPSEAAKLGGYSNAEEKESQALAKQQAILDIYKKHFPNYTPKKATVTSDSPEAIAKLSDTKNNLNNNNQQHIDGLTILAQANEKEYKTRVLSLPTTLNASQTNLKTKAQASYKKQQDLLAQAAQTTDNVRKKNLLIDANKSGQDAINLLSQISNPTAVANNSSNAGNETNTNNAANNNTASNSTNNAVNNNTAANNNSANNTNANNTLVNPSNTVKIKVEGLEVKNTNAYTADKPIPMDEKIPDGLVFKVQIGAFKSPLPNNTFKGLSPVIAQTTPNGYIRYMAGHFEQYSSANAVKNDLRTLGYSDAFVVAYYNGKRINLNEATDKAKAAGQTVEVVANTSAGLTTNANVPKNTLTAPVNNVANAIDTQPVEITNELEKMNGLLYTVQIGVYSKQVTRAQLNNLRPIYTEKLPNGLYRYTAGIYNQSSRLLEDKRKVVDLGVKDAFVSAYYNAKRIPFAEGQKLQTEDNSLKMEAENPIIFSNSTTNTPANNNVAVNNTTAPVNNTTPATNAFSNGVTTGPVPTAENGVKTDDAGISFKVQIGAYKNQVPNEVASKFSNIKTWPVQNVVINGLYIYTIGNFTGLEFAKKLKDEAVSIGIQDAYITVYKDGKKLYGAESLQYLNR